MWIPKKLESLEEGGLDAHFVEESILKILASHGSMRGSDFADVLKLPYSLVEPVIKELRDRDLIGMMGGSGIGGNAGLDFGLTPKGLENAESVKRRSIYFGPAPVELSVYREAVQNQKFNFQGVRKAHLEASFSDIKISQAYLNQLGPAVNSGGPIFLYGKPGNGKTTMAERIARLFRQGIFVPYVLKADNEVITVFDEKVHRPIPISALPDNHPVKQDPRSIDSRWVYCIRPFIVVGGELTLEMLDLTSRPGQRAYEAPFQLKANGGVLLVDDFGRQKVKPAEFLNRWIYPLEKGMDFLTLSSGKKIEVPFEQLIILSTNLDPRDLGDEAFWRRIKYMVETPSPNEAEYKVIFQTICAKKKIEFDEDAFAYLVDKYYRKSNRQFRSVHPRDLLNRVSDHICYYGLPPKLTRELIDFAGQTVFGALAKLQEEVGKAA